MNSLDRSQATRYAERLASYYLQLKSKKEISGEVIWSSAVLAVVDTLPHPLKEEQFVEIVLAGERQKSDPSSLSKAA